MQRTNSSGLLNLLQRSAPLHSLHFARSFLLTISAFGFTSSVFTSSEERIVIGFVSSLTSTSSSSEEESLELLLESEEPDELQVLLESLSLSLSSSLSLSLSLRMRCTLLLRYSRSFWSS